MSKTNSRVSFLLLIVSLVTAIAFARAHASANLSHPQVAIADSQDEPSHGYKAAPDPFWEEISVYTEFSARDQSDRWKIHLALYLAKRPELDQEQKLIILDAISAARPEFFATDNSAAARSASADEGLQSLTKRVMSAFSMNAAAEIFDNANGRKTQDDLLQKYRDIAALPMKKRRAVFRRNSPKDKSDLWKTHLALYLVKDAELSEEQKQVILTAMSLATVEGYMADSNQPGWPRRMEVLGLLESQIHSVFSREKGALIFATLGDSEPAPMASTLPVSPSSSLHRPDSRNFSMRIPNRFVGQDMGDLGYEKGCECNSGSDWCWNYCGGGVCTYASSGCGTLWQYACSGLCH
jgi:hypothetical protein